MSQENLKEEFIRINLKDTLPHDGCHKFGARLPHIKPFPHGSILQLYIGSIGIENNNAVDLYALLKEILIAKQEN